MNDNLQYLNFMADVELACFYALSKPKVARKYAILAIKTAKDMSRIDLMMKANDLLAAMEI